MVTDFKVSVIDPEVSAFAVIWPTHGDPPKASRQASRFEWYNRYAFFLLQGNVNRVNCALGDHVNPIWVNRADVVAQLRMAMAPGVSPYQYGGGKPSDPMGIRDSQVGDSEGKETPLARKNERLGRAISKIERM